MMRRRTYGYGRAKCGNPGKSNQPMSLRWMLAGVIVSAVPFVGGCEPGKENGMTGSCPTAGDKRIVEVLLPIREEKKMPAMAAALVTSRGVEMIGAVGVRKAGFPDAVTLDDLWHLGSDTKAMTATLIARLVER